MHGQTCTNALCVDESLLPLRVDRIKSRIVDDVLFGAGPHKKLENERKEHKNHRKEGYREVVGEEPRSSTGIFCYPIVFGSS